MPEAPLVELGDVAPALQHLQLVNIKVDSYRLREKKKAGLLGRKPKPPTEVDEEVEAEA